MKRYTVQIARIEHHIYELEIEAENADAAEEAAFEEWDNGGDMFFTDMGCVHAEEFVHEVKPAKVAA
jgi:hypothetical protein